MMEFSMTLTEAGRAIIVTGLGPSCAKCGQPLGSCFGTLLAVKDNTVLGGPYCLPCALNSLGLTYPEGGRVHRGAQA